jgi:hypothetical protein
MPQESVTEKEKTMLTAKSAKLTLVLDPAEVAAWAVPEGQKHFKFKVRYIDAHIEVQLSTKGARKTVAIVKELGVDGVAVIIQGKLKVGQTATGQTTISIEEAGILAQPKSKKEAPAADQAQAA